jgi:subtilisin family serine protease
MGVAVVAFAAALTTSTPSQAADTPPAAGSGGDLVAVPGSGGQTWTVTLITGDSVRLTEDAGGRYTATPEPGPRPDGHIPTFNGESGPDGIFVIPDDVQPAVDAGILDRQLFDVKYLALNGYADAKDKQLPVIVQYKGRSPQASVNASAEALPASDATRSLPSIHGAAVKVDKKKAEDFWATLRGSSRAASGLAPKALTGGVGKVWLDEKVTADLSESVPLIGAPEAWKAGLDGSGTTVAVLDTGIDATHPDLAGKIAASRSFVDGEEVADGNGHGTHVASTIVGSGAASNGSRKGVAPGARLAVGKVLNNAGSGESSDIIAGMQWAVGEAGAKVVSMSLGSNVPSDGTDPMSQAVNSLSASTGALFVIAAGNAGPSETTIGAPGVADAALTVAATDKSDKLAWFSSRGPRYGDGALKPDIAAPGVNIAAARAAGTTLGTPVDAYYTTASGTSMATPHIAGAAAILAQEHPDWNGERIKATLMSTAKDDGYTVYQQGAGRVDAARATSQKVAATTAHVDYGNVVIGDDKPVEKTVTYTNSGDSDVTLTLTPTLKGAVGALTVGAPTVTVPAGGTAQATVTLHPEGLDEASYSGSLVATDDAGARVTVPVGVQHVAKTVPLTVHTLDRDGKPADMYRNVSSVDVRLRRVIRQEQVAEGVMRYWVKPGTYAVQARTSDTDGGDYVNRFLYAPEVAVPDGGTDITLDTRKTVPLTFETPKPIDTANAFMTVTTLRTTWDGTTLGSLTYGNLGRVFVTPTERVTKGTFLFDARVRAWNPQVSVAVAEPDKSPLNASQFGWTDKGLSWLGATPFPRGTQRRQVAYVGLARPDDIARADLKGKIALQVMDPDEEAWAGHPIGCRILNERVQWLKDAGAVGVLLTPSKVDARCSVPTWTQPSGQAPALPVAQLVPEEGKRLRTLLDHGPVTVKVTGNPDIDYLYNLQEFEEQQIPDNLTYHYTRSQLSEVTTEYHTGGPLQAVAESWVNIKPIENFVMPTASALAGPSAHPEYFNKLDPDVLHRGDAALGTQLRAVETIGSEPDESTRRWGTTPLTPGPTLLSEGPYGPSLLGECTICRQGDVLIPTFHQVVGNGRQSVPGSFYAPDTRLFRQDGTEIPKTSPPRFPNMPLFSLPKESGTYRLELNGGGTVAAWTFNSRARDADTVSPRHICPGWMYGTSGPCNPQPLVFVGYDLGGAQALDNTVPAGRDHTFEVDVNHQASTEPMPKIAGLKLAYSTDDGATWKDAQVREVREGVYTTTLTYPELDRTTGAVSLRAEAWDADGNKVEQTTTRAFPLR